MVIHCDTSAKEQQVLLLLDFTAVILLNYLSDTKDSNVVKQRVI